VNIETHLGKEKEHEEEAEEEEMGQSILFVYLT
jgi:hypothetical protein